MKNALFALLSRPEILDFGDRALVNGSYFAYGGTLLGPAKTIRGGVGAAQYRLVDPMMYAFYTRCAARSMWGGTISGSGDWSATNYKPSGANAVGHLVFASTQGTTAGQKFTIRYGNQLWRIEADYSLTFMCSLANTVLYYVTFADEDVNYFYLLGKDSNQNYTLHRVTKGSWTSATTLTTFTSFGTKYNPIAMIDSDFTNAKYPLFMCGPTTSHRALTPSAEDFGARAVAVNGAMNGASLSLSFDGTTKQFLHALPIAVSYGGKMHGYSFYQRLNADGTTVDTGVVRYARGDAALTKQTLDLTALPGGFPTTADFVAGDVYNTACDSFTYTSGEDTFIGFFVHQMLPKNTELLDVAKYGINASLSNTGSRVATTLASFIAVFKITGADSLSLVSYTALDTADGVVMAVFNPRTKQLLGASPSKGVVLYENTADVYTKGTTHSEIAALEIFCAAGAFYVYDADSVLWQISSSPVPPQVSLSTAGENLNVSASLSGSAVNVDVQVTLVGMTFADGSTVKTVTTPAQLPVLRKSNKAYASAKVI